MARLFPVGFVLVLTIGLSILNGCNLSCGTAANLTTLRSPSCDTDSDGIADNRDNCVNVPNNDQADADTDGLGDVCDGGDSDSDGVIDSRDNCPSIPNSTQADRNNDHIGDACHLVAVANVTDNNTDLYQIENVQAVSTFGQHNVNYLSAGGLDPNTGGTSGGFTVFSIEESNYSNMNLNAIDSDNEGDNGSRNLYELSTIVTAIIDESHIILTASSFDKGITAYELEGGSLTYLNQINHTTQLNGVNSLATATIGTQHYLFAGSSSNKAITVMEITKSDAALSFSIADFEQHSNLDGVKDIAVAQINNRHFLFAGAQTTEQIAIYLIDPDDGTLSVSSGTNLIQDSDNINYNLKQVQSLAVVTLEERTYVVAGSQEGLSVFRITADNSGSISHVNTHNVSHGPTLVLQNISDIAPYVHNTSRYLTLVSGTENILHLFKLESTGQLTHLTAVTDGDTSGATELAGAASVTVFAYQNQPYVLVAGADDDGISILRLKVR